MPVARDPHARVEIEKYVHERIVIRNFNNRPVRKHLFDSSLKYSPGPLAMQVIHQQEAAAQTILSQASGFVRRWAPIALAGLLQEYKRIFKDLIVTQFQVPFFIGNFYVGCSQYHCNAM